jgi:MoaA/NifB/PqqE/SkfB family radical SAM enzyme
VGLEKRVSEEHFRSLVKGRIIYIYAVSLEGIGFAKAFKRMRLDVGGFIDTRYRGQSRVGLPIVPPEEFFNTAAAKKAVVGIASKDRSYRYIAIEQCEAIGLVKNESFFIATELCPNLPTVEIVGLCNLRCASCNMGLQDIPAGGYMDVESYRHVIEKMIREIPFMNSVYLYLWGEPFLHPKLPEIIEVTNELGLAVDVSSNFNKVDRLDEVVKAAPDMITISCSGVGKNYELTHKGGKWEKFKRNVHLLKEYMDKYDVQINARLYYHMYKHNLGEDYDIIQNMAQELGFSFYPIAAQIFPEKIYHHVLDGDELPIEMQEINERLLFPVEDQLSYAYERKDTWCATKKVFPTVRWDLSVVQCCNLMDPVIADNYLTVTVDDLLKAREEEPICRICMNKGLHRYFDVHCVVEEKDGKRTVVRR